MSSSTQPTVFLEYRRRPSALRFMATALYPSPGFDPDRPFPKIRARWSGHRVDDGEYRDLLRLAGAAASPTNRLPLLYPHVIGFRLQMVVLTHPRFPVPIWRVLQIRNHLVQHRPIDRYETLDFETQVAAHRVLDKGLEVDLRTEVRAGAQIAWESVNTFYVRGRFGTPEAPSPLAASPTAGSEIVKDWKMTAGESLRFGSLTGDYNGIHLSDRYASLFGFDKAFFHPSRVLGHCLAHLGCSAVDTPYRVDAWLKGPVYHDSQVRLCADHEARQARTFALYSEHDERPTIVGRMSPITVDSHR